ncbi:S-methyl-5-thioribose kinase [Paenibacillus sp. J2TS4]|uniref:S-methyl-5-thioribose kinase n=1 Tax=Paenibacillus sp. J2TS4 TaxID=2807194 RepID=UPI001B135EBD|nr:S-methyl-5-thioribose kinase [Paenibacillus sp. J2TS4]GIP33667.1 methylthioribose kinase [Paenibacillus sp. J2TS4]
MSYHPLSLEEAVQYAADLPDLFAPDAQLSVREIGDGNLNLVFHITDRNNNKSIIMKQALPYAKVVGESWPLTLDRARIESEALQLQASLCPGLVPKVYAYDSGLALTVMEDLSDHVIMRQGLIEGNRYPLFAEHVGKFMAHTLFYTSDLGMNQQAKKLQVKQFINPELCKITEDLIFDDPYTDSENNNFNPLIREEVERLWQDEELHYEVALLREAFLTHAEALLHGDLHTGSIFITPESTKMIDPEFAYYGPMGFDIGAVVANLLLNYAGQEGWMKEADKRAEYRRYLLNTVREVWEHFSQTFQQLWEKDAVDRMARVPGYREYYLQKVLRDTIGFAGCKMIRRIVGLAHVADIDTIEDAKARTQAEIMAIEIGRSLIKLHRQAESIDEVIAIAEQAAQ